MNSFVKPFDGASCASWLIEFLPDLPDLPVNYSGEIRTAVPLALTMSIPPPCPTWIVS